MRSFRLPSDRGESSGIGAGVRAVDGRRLCGHQQGRGQRAARAGHETGRGAHRRCRRGRLRLSRRSENFENPVDSEKKEKKTLRVRERNGCSVELSRSRSRAVRVPRHAVARDSSGRNNGFSTDTDPIDRRNATTPTATASDEKMFSLLTPARRTRFEQKKKNFE